MTTYPDVAVALAKEFEKLHVRVVQDPPLGDGAVGSLEQQAFSVIVALRVCGFDVVPLDGGDDGERVAA